MTIRTIENLYDFLSDELAWRRKELAALRSLINQQTSAPSRRNALLRSAITMAYAHWEGFVKASATAYLEFVAMRRLKNEDLASNFVALSVRSLVIKMTQSKKARDHIQVAEFFLNEMTDKSKIPYKDVIDTQSNLSSAVFENIVVMLGLDFSVFATKEKLLDEKLLKVRNSIAHGQYMNVDSDDVLILLDQIQEMMNQFRNQIDNAASMELYKFIPRIG